MVSPGELSTATAVMQSAVERLSARSLQRKNNGVMVKSSWFGLDTGNGAHGYRRLGTEVISCDDTPKGNFKKETSQTEAFTSFAAEKTISREEHRTRRLNRLRKNFLTDKKFDHGG
jgi:hypothetical protein